MRFGTFFGGTLLVFSDRRLGHFAVVHGCEHGEDVRLDDGVHQREQDAHDDGQHKGERDIIVDELGHEHPAQQRAEETETHRNGQGELFERQQQPSALVCRDAADHDEEIAQAAQRDRTVDVGEGRGQRDAPAALRRPRYAHEFEEGAYEDIDARRKDIGAQYAVAVGAVAPCKPVKHPDDLFEEHLELAGDALELRDDEDAHGDREDQNDPRHEKRRNEPGIDGQTKEVDLVLFVQDGILHRLLDVLRALVQPVRQDDARNEQGGKERHDRPKEDFLPFCHGTLPRRISAAAAYIILRFLSYVNRLTPVFL